MASYREELEAWAASAGSDGCTVVPEFYRICCLEHDYAYVTGYTFRGRKVSKAEADQRFRDCIQANSSFRFLSPMSWWRWLGVKWFGHGAWDEPAHRRLLSVSDYDLIAEAMAARRRIIEELA